MSSNVTLIVVINNFYAYEIEIDVTKSDQAINKAVSLHQEYLKNLNSDEGFDAEANIFEIRVCKKITNQTNMTA